MRPRKPPPNRFWLLTQNSSSLQLCAACLNFPKICMAGLLPLTALLIGLSCVALRTANFLSTSSYNQVNHKAHFCRLRWKAQFSPSRIIFKKRRRKKERKKERERRKEGGSEEGRRKEGGRKQGREEALWTVFDVISHCVFKCPKLAKVPFVSPL